MTIEIDVVVDVWLTCKEYITPKDRQAAADHLVNVVADHDVTEDDLRALGGTDGYLKRAVQEYMVEDGSDDDYEDSIGDDDY